MRLRALPALTLISAAGLAALTACSAPLNQAALNPGVVRQANLGSAQVNRVAIRVQDPRQATVPGEIVIRYKPGVALQTRSQTLASFKLTTLSVIGRPEMGIELVKSNDLQATQRTLEALRRHPAVLYAEPNFVVTLPPVMPGQNLPPVRSNGPDDEMFAQQYAHKVSNSVAGWAINAGSEKVTIAVIDTGVDLKHPDLAGKIVAGRDIVDGDDEAMDGHYHGTHCAGIAAAMTNNKVGIAGFAPNVKIMPIRVLDNGGSGTSADVANGIIWAADHGAQVISMSLGGRGNPQVKKDAVDYALAKDSVLVAAMGNYGDNSQIFPAAQPGVLAVGATDSADKRASFSQYGKWISVTAPGVSILSTFPTYNTSGKKNYGSISGTSMATPAAAGVVALIRSQFPEMNGVEVKAQLERGTDDLGEPGYDTYFGHGRINVAKALTPARF